MSTCLKGTWAQAVYSSWYRHADMHRNKWKMSFRNKSHVFYTWSHQCLNICFLVFKFYLLIYFYCKRFACMYDFVPGISYIYIVMELELQMWVPMWVLGIYPVVWNYNLLTTEPPLEPSIYSFNALKFAWLFESFVPGHFVYYHPHFHLFQMKLCKYYVLTVWWGHFTFFSHFSGNSLVLVLANFSMNFRMHLSNSKISLVIFLWALLSTYSVSIYYSTLYYIIFFSIWECLSLWCQGLNSVSHDCSASIPQLNYVLLESGIFSGTCTCFFR